MGDTELKLLELAEKDLEASRTLYEKNLYPQAVFYLEQSIEKGIKSLGLHDGTLSKENLAGEIGHRPLKYFSKWFEHWKEVGRVIENSNIRNIFPELRDIRVIEGLPDQTDKIEEINEKLEGFSKKRDISEKELMNSFTNILVSQKRIERSKENFDVDEEWKYELSKWESIFSMFEKLFPNSSEGIREKVFQKMEKNKSDFKESLEKTVFYYYELAFCSLTLLELSRIFTPHSIDSRYPNEDFNPLEFYTEDFPLIKKFDSIIEMVEEVFQKMELFLKKSHYSPQKESMIPIKSFLEEFEKKIDSKKKNGA